MNTTIKKTTTKKTTNIGYLAGLIIFTFGLVSFIRPEIFIVLLMVAFGVSLILSGISQVTQKLGLFSAVLGTVSIVVGTFSLLSPVLFGEAIWTTLLLILGIERIVHVVLALIMGFKLKFNFPKGEFIMNILFSLLVAILLIAAPHFVGVTILRVVAVIVMILGGLSLVATYKGKKKTTSIKGA